MGSKLTAKGWFVSPNTSGSMLASKHRGNHSKCVGEMQTNKKCAGKVVTLSCCVLKAQQESSALSALEKRCSQERYPIDRYRRSSSLPPLSSTVWEPPITRESANCMTPTLTGQRASCRSHTATENNREGRRLFKCLRCGAQYDPEENFPTACSYHGHMTGDKGLFSFAPPHQGIDGEWTDKSGVIVYKWAGEDQRPNTGRENWKRRWTCCGVYDESAPPCRKGPHVSYDDGYTLH